MKFTKMEGCGNDYVYVNLFKEKVAEDLRSKLAIDISDRHFGVGSDGLVFIAPTEEADAEMIMYNADGTISEMCGNAIRCVAKLLFDKGIVSKETMKIKTGNGVLTLESTLKDNRVEKVRVNMGKPVLKGTLIPTTFDKEQVIDVTIKAADLTFDATCVSMGNPHCIIYVADVKNFDVQKYGSIIENLPEFPNRINIEFVQILNKNEVIQRTWERGAGETLACGTGASAVCVAGVLKGVTSNRLLNHLTGGNLNLEWDGEGEPVFMTGPAKKVYKGYWNL